MSVRSTLVLLVIALGLGLWIYFGEMRGGGEDGEESAPRILTLEPDAVTALEVPLPDEGGTARIVRDAEDAERWRLEAPIVWPADAGAISGLLTTLSGLEAKATVEDPPADRTPFGLGEDALRLRVWSGAGKPAGLRIGGEAPLDDTRYVAVEGDEERIYTIEGWRAGQLRPSLLALRDKRLTAFDAADVTEVRVREKGEELVHAVRAGETEAGAEETWRLTTPIETQADASRIRRLIEDLSFARATGFVDAPEAPAAYGLDTPEIEIDLGAGGREERIALGRKDTQAYARVEGKPVVFRVADRVLGDVPRTLFDYRFKRVLAVDETQADAIELRFPREGEVAYRFRRDDDRWVPEEDGVEVESLRIADIVYTLRELDATGLESDVSDPGSVGLDPPGVRVSVFDAEGSELGWLELGDVDPSAGLAAYSSQTDRIWRVENDLGKDVPLTHEAFRNSWLQTDAPEGGDEPDEAVDPQTPENDEEIQETEETAP